ncbi:hypothetical protein [Marinomonas ostreistagni]|uniref:hypothetical protein n=1 Tax=Marinomonas ostreistagni TaxID=359209 RepID=UPI00194DCFF2|nr:hypothetical protein [Marinomonas ostreistagni]MBM6551957.1 hypothetical protein [Marinomonas ostreistagni]
MFEFALFAAAMVGAFLMARSLINQASQPKMKAQPIKIDTQKQARRKRDQRYP